MLSNFLTADPQVEMLSIRFTVQAIKHDFGALRFVGRSFSAVQLLNNQMEIGK